MLSYDLSVLRHPRRPGRRSIRLFSFAGGFDHICAGTATDRRVDAYSDGWN
jgi:hypothetical protein